MKGLMLTAPGGSKFWHPCKDPETGLKEMAALQAELNFYGAAWKHDATVIEYGTVEGNVFTASSRIRGAAIPEVKK